MENEVNENGLWLGWTTLESAEDAARMADRLVREGLAACVQVEGPVTSYYPWKRKVECGEEYRLFCKFMGSNLGPIRRFLADNHPYDTPEWVAIPAGDVAEKYLKWARKPF